MIPALIDPATRDLVLRAIAGPAHDWKGLRVTPDDVAAGGALRLMRRFPYEAAEADEAITGR
jgi:hypothetical protein